VRDQCFLLRERPAFELALTFKRGFAILKRFQMGKRYRSATRSENDVAFVVSKKPLSRVSCLANVQTSVSTAKDVDVMHEDDDAIVLQSWEALRLGRYAPSLRAFSQSGLP
jgi:hypothetical protein